MPPKQFVAARDRQRPVSTTGFSPHRADHVVGRARQTRVLSNLVDQTLCSGPMYVGSFGFAPFHVRSNRVVVCHRSFFGRFVAVFSSAFRKYRRVAARRVTAEEMELHAGPQGQTKTGFVRVIGRIF